MLTNPQLLQGGLGVTGFDGVAHMIEGMSNPRLWP